MSAPLTPSETRALLTRLGHHPRLSLGQNFLIDGNIVRKSIELAEIRTGDVVVEIGPGLGTLTGTLLAAGAEVWAIERDTTLYSYLSAVLCLKYPGTLHLLAGDAVEHPLAGLEKPPPDFKIVSNLPYAISGPWLDAVLEGPLPRRLVLMLQREAAERYTAEPGTKAFGALSILLQSAYDLQPGHRVSAACFYPRPEVESTLLNLSLKARPFLFPPRAKGIIRLCFQQRRKQIGGLLHEHLPGIGRLWLEHLRRAGIPPTARPEAIPPEAWQSLASTLFG